MTSIFTDFDQSKEIEEFIKKITIAIQDQGVVHGLGSVKKVLGPNGLERKELRTYVESEDGVPALSDANAGIVARWFFAQKKNDKRDIEPLKAMLRKVKKEKFIKLTGETNVLLLIRAFRSTPEYKEKYSGENMKKELANQKKAAAATIAAAQKASTESIKEFKAIVAKHEDELAKTLGGGITPNKQTPQTLEAMNNLMDTAIEQHPGMEAVGRFKNCSLTLTQLLLTRTNFSFFYFY